MTHLTSDELIDAIEGALASDRQGHLAECDQCRRQRDDLSRALHGARQVDAPEPSPLFWTQFSSRVNDAIDSEPPTAWPQWLRWQVLLPLGAAAMVIMALMLSVPKAPVIETPEQTADVTDVPEADNWIVFADLVGELDLETASAAGVLEPGMADQAVLELTAEEQQELGRLLQAELTRAKS